MELRYEMSLEDAVALGRSIQAASPAMQRHRALARWGAPVLALGLLGLFGYVSGEPLYYIFAPVVAIGFLAFSHRLYDSALERQMRKVYAETKRDVLEGPRTLKICEAGLEGSSALGSGSFLWSAITHVEESDERLVVHLSNLTGLVIARAAVSAGDYDAFVAELKQRYEYEAAQA